MALQDAVNKFGSLVALLSYNDTLADDVCGDEGEHDVVAVHGIAEVNSALRGSVQVDEDHSSAPEVPAAPGGSPGPSQLLHSVPTSTMTPSLVPGESGGPCADRAPSPGASTPPSRSSQPVSASPNDPQLDADSAANGTPNSLSASDLNDVATSGGNSFDSTSSKKAGTEALDSDQASTSSRTAAADAVVVGWCFSLKCGQAMSSWESQVLHFREHHVRLGMEQGGFCDRCLSYCPSAMALDNHMNQHLQGIWSGSGFSCPKCAAHFLSEDHLESHVTRFHEPK